ncbi:505_t:CDS:2, partial [Ambispora leptoticha]
MANSWHAYFDRTDAEDWNILQFHIEWIQDNEKNPVNLAYDKSLDTLAKSLRAIVNKHVDDKKVTKAKSLLAVIKARGMAFSYSSDGLLARCGLCSGDSKCLLGNDIDNLWLTIENKMCDRRLNKERKKLEILQVKGIAQATSQSQSYAFALNDSALANLELTATKINQDQELFGSKKDEIPKSIADSENNPFLVSEDEYVCSQRILNEGTKLPAPNKRGNKIERDVLTRKKAKKNVKSYPQPINGMSSFESLPSDEDNKEHSEEDDMEINFDLTIISTELQREPTVKWEVGHINVTDRFRQYQKEIIEKAGIEGLKYDNIYELLALSSIIVLSWPCPYPSLFTIQEWKEVTKNNPYTVQESSLSPGILSSINEASFNHFLGMDAFMEGGKSKLSRLVARAFNDLYDSVMNIAPLKLSEEEHCLRFVYPISRPFFVGEKEYDLVLNRSNSGSKKRPDLSCVVNG